MNDVHRSPICLEGLPGSAPAAAHSSMIVRTCSSACTAELRPGTPGGAVGGDLLGGQPAAVHVAEQVVLGADVGVHPRACVVEHRHAGHPMSRGRPLAGRPVRPSRGRPRCCQRTRRSTSPRGEPSGALRRLADVTIRERPVGGLRGAPYPPTPGPPGKWSVISGARRSRSTRPGDLPHRRRRAARRRWSATTARPSRSTSPTSPRPASCSAGPRRSTAGPARRPNDPEIVGAGRRDAADLRRHPHHRHHRPLLRRLPVGGRPPTPRAPAGPCRPPRR